MFCFLKVILIDFGIRIGIVINLWFWFGMFQCYVTVENWKVFEDSAIGLKIEYMYWRIFYKELKVKRNQKKFSGLLNFGNKYI